MGTKLKGGKVKKGTGCEGSELGNDSRLDRDFLENGSEKSEKRTNGLNGHKIEPKMINLHRKCRFFDFYIKIFAYIEKKQYLCRAKVCRKRKCQVLMCKI